MWLSVLNVIVHIYFYYLLWHSKSYRLKIKYNLHFEKIFEFVFYYDPNSLELSNCAFLVTFSVLCHCHNLIDENHEIITEKSKTKTSV